MSADDAVMRARQDAPNPVMWRTASDEAVMDGSAARAPEQRSTVYRDWGEFRDHQPAPPSSNAEPDFITARQHTPQVPGREPPDVIRGV